MGDLERRMHEAYEAMIRAQQRYAYLRAEYIAMGMQSQKWSDPQLAGGQRALTREESALAELTTI